MLEIRPNCEFCDKDLAADSTEAMICTYECTFCSECVNTVFENVCPNCGGGLASRPIRPKSARRSNVSLLHHPASEKRVHTIYTAEELKEFSAPIKNIPPKDR